MKTEEEVQHKGYRYAYVGAWSVLIVAVTLAAWSGQKYPLLTQKWFSWPEAWLTSVPLVLAGIAFILLIRSLLTLEETSPLICNTVLVALLTLATAATIHPYAIPPSVTLEAAAAPRNILLVLLIVMAILLPIMLIDNGYNVAAFRGKTTGGYGGEEVESPRD